MLTTRENYVFSQSRRKGYSASYALQAVHAIREVAKWDEVPYSQNPPECLGSYRRTFDGIEVKVSIFSEYGLQMGTFADDERDFPESKFANESFLREAYEVNERNGKYFIPGEDLGDGLDFDSFFECQRAWGMAKDEARLVAREKLASLVRRIVREDEYFVFVRVDCTDSITGEPLGEGDSLGGIVGDNEGALRGLDSALDSAINTGMVEEALASAQEARKDRTDTERMAKAEPVGFLSDGETYATSGENPFVFAFADSLGIIQAFDVAKLWKASGSAAQDVARIKDANLLLRLEAHLEN